MDTTKAGAQTTAVEYDATWAGGAHVVHLGGGWTLHLFTLGGGWRWSLVSDQGEDVDDGWGKDLEAVVEEIA